MKTCGKNGVEFIVTGATDLLSEILISNKDILPAYLPFIFLSRRTLFTSW